MKRYAAIAMLVFAAFIAEFILFNAFGSWGKPQLILIVIVFCGLYWGIRHGIWAACIGGLLKDAYSIDPFGTHVFIFIAAAYLTTFIRKNLYQPGSRFSRAVVVFFVVIAVFILELLVHMRLFDLRITEALEFVFLPQLLLTMVCVTFIFHRLRDAAIIFKL